MLSQSLWDFIFWCFVQSQVCVCFTAVNVVLRLFAAKSSLKQVSALQVEKVHFRTVCFVLCYSRRMYLPRRMNCPPSVLICVWYMVLLLLLIVVFVCRFWVSNCGFLNQSLECVMHKAFKQCFYRVDKTRYLPSKNEEIPCDVCENLKQPECYFTEIAVSYCVPGHC